MRIPRKAGHAIASTLAAFLVVCGLCGSTCSVSVCKEDCDPCLSKCHCDTICDATFLRGREAYKLRSYRLSIVDDDRGGVIRWISEIVLAPGVRAHTAADFVRFAEGVIESNGLLLRSRRGAWVRQPVEVFEDAVVVPFTSEGAGASLTFLFDRDGTLLQIDEVRSGAGIAADPR